MLKPVKILQASAGSGKTFSLAVYYLTLLFSNETKYREILAVTFTNKATEEMKSRILDVLKGLADGNDSEKIENYRQLILESYPNYTKQQLQLKADIIYRRILHDYSRFSVSTIDGFVQKVIRGFAFELNLDAAYTLEMNIDKVKDNLVERLDKALDNNAELVQWIINLAKERIDNNKSWNYKTELLNLTGEIFKERFSAFDEALNKINEANKSQLFKDYAKTSKDAILTFENTLVDFAKQGLALMDHYGLEANRLKGMSRNQLFRFNKIANKDFKDIEKLFAIIDDPENWFKDNASQESYPEINSFLKKIEAYYSSNYPNYILSQEFNKNVYFLRLMIELAALLKDYRQESGNLLISDAQQMLSKITTDAGDNPSFIWEKIGNKYKNFLFDEFQDTSVKQWDSFLPLVQNAVSEPSGNLIDHLIVGDTKQAIYRWRNGDWNILHQQARQDLGSHNVIDAFLEENYRSSTNIISFNNQLYEKLAEIIQNKINANVSAENNHNLSDWWQKSTYNEVVRNIYANSAQKTTAKTLEGGVIKIKKFVKEEEDESFTEAIFKEKSLGHVITEISNLQLNHHYLYKDMCILVRTNTDAVSAVQALMDAQIPVISGEALLIANNTAIKLIINTLYTLVGYDENTSLYKANCIALYHKTLGKNLNNNSYLGLRFKNLRQLTGLLPKDLCNNAEQWIQLPLPELVEKIISSYGLDKNTDKEKPTPYLPYLLAFRDIIGNATKNGEKGIHSFLKWWDEDGIKKALPSPEDANAVQVLTIHKSKGLAFRAVFIPFSDLKLSGNPDKIIWVPAANTPYENLGSIPLKYTKSLAKSTVSKYYYEEELYSHLDCLNMLYVATTRAKDYLFIGLKGKAEKKKKIEEKESLSTIGDLINHIYKPTAIEEEEAPHYLVEIDDYIIEKEDNHQKNIINLKEYPTSDRISEIYLAVNDKDPKHLLNIEKAGIKGSILHDILANVKNETELITYVDKLNIEGIIALDKKDDFINSSIEVLNHPELKALLEKADFTIEEKAIIDVKGKALRPDKILVSKEETIIIDYKFTEDEQESHINQLQRYKILLAEMGYPKVSAYLFYALINKLKAI